MISKHERQRILIWGKTYPELSTKYLETVCTAGVTETGCPVRLYPIPYRYLSEQFNKYQWISATIAKNPNDPRPESYRVDCDSIECGENIASTRDEWGKRAVVVFRDKCWQFSSMDELQAAQRERGTSLGVVAPREISKIEVVKRGEDESHSFEEKFKILQRTVEAQRAQLTLFAQAIPPEMKHLDFLKARVQVNWKCHDPHCSGHRMQVLDWEVNELQRKCGDEAAVAKLRELADLSKYDLRFFLGNLFLYPQSFMIVGLWYPKRSNLLFR